MDAVIPRRHDESRIGLLGGSFNPAHEGHRAISVAALEALDLDAVWWLVSPGNPLKAQDDYAPFEQRLATARRVAGHKRIVVSNFEARQGLRYTVDTIEALIALWPQIRFVWMMGADALVSFHHWKDWRRIADLVPIAVFSRPGFENAADVSEAARSLTPFRVEPPEAASIVGTEPPVWTFIPSTTNPTSSTAIRSRCRPPRDQDA